MSPPINPEPSFWSALTAYLTTAFSELYRAATLIFTSRDDPPHYHSPLFRFGYLQGTFGLPYGGHLVTPPALPETVTLTTSMPMFACLGTSKEIGEFLAAQKCTAILTTNVPCGTGGLVVEVYRDTSVDWLCGWWDRGRRQLVVRAQRSFAPREFKPLVRILVPQGVLLSEIAEVLARCRSCGEHDFIRDKRLNVGIVARARSVPVVDLDDAQLPPYQKPSLPLPPPYEP